GAEADAGGAFFGATRGDEGGRAEGSGELDGCGADAAGAAGDEKALAGLGVADLEHVRPGRAGRLGNSGRFFHREPYGYGEALGLRHGAVFGVTAAGNECADAIALLEARLRGNFGDGSGDLEA